MKGCKFVDTNVLIRLWEEKPEFVNWFTRLSNNKKNIYVPSIVIAEVIWVLSSFYKKSRVEVKKFVDSVVNTKCIKIVTKHDINKALYLYENSNVKFTDCIIASYLNTNDVIISEDHDFDKLSDVRRENVLSQLS